MRAATTTAKIVRNSLWYGLETSLELVAFIATSIAVARALGPEKLGLYTSISYPIILLNSLGGVGLPLATRKYMAEYLGAGRPGLARAVYGFTFKIQLLASVGLSAAIAAAVLVFVAPENRPMGLLLALSVLPGMLSCLAAQTNLAFEDASKNAITGVAYVVSYGLTVALTLHFGWELPGLAAAVLIGRTAEMSFRLAPLQRRIRALSLEPLDAAVRARIQRFCVQAIGVQVLTSVVWNRSELIFLSALSDVKQVAYYGVSSGVADRLLIAPTVFATATGISLMTESTRDPRRVNSIVGNACRFLSFIAMPINLGAAAIASQAMTVAYGPKYLSAIPVMAIAAALAIPRAFQNIPDTLLRASDRQPALLRAMIVTGIINVAVDIPLIMNFGAMGAAIGKSIAQTIGVLLLFRAARAAYHFDWPLAAVLRFGAAGIVMACAAFAAAQPFPAPALGIAAAITVAVPVYIVSVRLFRAFEPEDCARLSQLATRLPRRLRSAVLGVLRFAVGEDRAVAGNPAEAPARPSR